LSLGAAAAIDFTILHPEQTESLVLVCPGLGGFHFEDKANNLRPIVEAARDESYEKAAELWLQNPYMSVAMENPALRKRLRQLAMENAHCWLNNPLLLRRMNPPAAERLREIHAPTLVIGDERDVSDIHKIIAKLTAEIDGAQRRIVSGAGHLVPMEKPDEFNHLALEFMARSKR
jgi:pimeloyl-ACP methyl ester carboxylesterase